MHLVAFLSLVSLSLAGSSNPLNLLENGDFEQNDQRNERLVPGWQPLRHGYDIITQENEHGQVLRFILSRETARGDGYRYFSNLFPIEDGKTYRCSVDVLTNGPQVTISVNGYVNFEGAQQKVYSRQIRSGKRMQPGQWEKIRFRFTPGDSTSINRRILEQQRKRLGPVEMLEVEFFIYGAEGGVLCLDNVKIEPAERLPATSRTAESSPTQPAATQTKR